MIPSLVASEVRTALVDYMATTFGLSDDDVRDALASFLTDPVDGIFRGPYLRVRTPFRTVDETWDSPLGWLPSGFSPFVHQAAAFERLSTVGGRTPEPTLVTTGTGSGKTECFLMPVLDHCARARDAAVPGVKAIILYPMNALASDQAGRLAALIDQEPRLRGLRAGLYVGENGSHASMGPDHLIDDRHVLRDEPPDILLTNYKMLDFLLLRREDQRLWATTGPDTLRYVVLDEFHTYDGAQGTDVAMLLRRLGATLGTARPGAPLGDAAPVATSATLGSDPSALVDLRDFAGKVFGTTFDEASVIGETRQGVDESCLPVDAELPTPSPFEVAELATDDGEALAAAFCARAGGALPADPVDLGERLLAHPVTRSVLGALADRPRPLAEAALEVAGSIPGWAELADEDPEVVQAALVRFLALISVARRVVGERDRPLFTVEVQLWIREVSRVLRTVAVEPSFRWLDSPPAVALVDSDPDAGGVDGAPVPAGVELPAVSCRRCGHSGWMATANQIDGTIAVKPTVIYESAVRRSPTTRIMLRARVDDEGVRWFDPVASALLDQPAPGAIPVHATADDNEATRQTCPACGEHNAVLFVGLAVASLASVSITTLFGSSSVDADERKLLAFTDSVQDASHRASFFTGRAHRFNNRSLMAGALRDAGDAGLSLADLGDHLVDEAGDDRRRLFELVPPDLLRDVSVRSVWSEDPDQRALEILRDRVGFEVDLEFGLRSRVGRTLEQSVASVASVELDDDAASLVLEAIADVVGDVPDSARAGADGYLLGLADRLRTSGAIRHSLLDTFVEEGGAQWWIWGGRPAGLPPFTPDQGRPTFATTAPKSDFDVLAPGRSLTWWTDWAVRSLGVPLDAAADVNQRVLATLAASGDAVVAAADTGGHTVYGLDRRAIRAFDIVDDGDAPAAAVVRCGHCGTAATVPPARLDEWLGVPCRRFRCVGTYVAQSPADSGYYRRLYRQGTSRRVVAGEHTGLLGRRAREELETAFKDGTAPDAPNVLTATPTLEMGIDIGDLSAVMLTSVPRNPASYIQRVGRAGRATGNSLVTTFVRSDTHGLYYLAEPESMLAGDVRPPNCYLEASETLRRQYVAFLIDRVADGTIAAEPLPAKMGQLMPSAGESGGLFQTLTDTSMSSPALVEQFLSLFGDDVGPEARERLEEFASGGIEPYLKDVTGRWFEQLQELSLRRDRLNGAIERLEAVEHRTEDDDEELRSLRGQRTAVLMLLRSHRDEYPLSGLERLGVLPNYSLAGDTATLQTSLWTRPRDADGEFESTSQEIARPALRALTEFAPGNTFYAGGHRHRVDALEIGAAKDPLYEAWRICPECAYADLETQGEPPATCPRCGSTQIANVGSRHTVLRLRTALASAPEESARVHDESDNRTKRRYTVATLVDPDPTEVHGAWLLEDRSFGAEFVGRVRLRTFNLGIADSPGDQTNLAGREYRAGRFTVCRRCGAVRNVRDDQGGRRPERLHHGWCKVRSGSVAEQWDPIILAHELVTEAIRLLVPVSMYEVDERLASFKGALLLGIREALGGNPDHLTVTVADAPNRGGQGRRRFLVLYDQIPGGTGYLAPLADPESIKQILVAARDAIARCPCRHEGRPACHRCLLGVVSQREYDLVRRDLARELLDSMLEEPFEPQQVATVGNANISGVEESELERRFKVAIREWADAQPDDRVTFTKVPGKGRFEAFELTVRFDGEVFRYKIAEQEGLSNLGSTLPDFVITRMDATGPKVAVYLDGYQFHASASHNNVAADASKRAKVREQGNLVWNLTWRDVEQFHEAIVADPPTNPPDRSLVPHGARLPAQQIQQARNGAFSVDAIEQNPVALLLDYLVRPDLAEWRRTVLSVTAGLAAASGLSDVDGPGLAQVLDAAQRSDWPEIPVPSGEVVARAARAVTPNGLPLALLLDMADPNAERWTVLAVLDDREDQLDSEAHRARWADWLPWSNLLQFLGAPEDQTAAVMSASSSADDLAWDDLWLRHRAAGEQAAEPEAAGSVARRELSEDEQFELDLLIGDAVRSLVTAVVLAGASFPKVGAEFDGVPIEAAWPDLRVAVLAPDGIAPDGWDARTADGWTVETLLAALEATS